jgi:hypothetical protein
LRYHDPENWPALRDALRAMGRSDLIGNGKKHLIPSFQPVGTGLGRSDATGSRTGTGKRAGRVGHSGQRYGIAMTQRTGPPPTKKR